MYLLNPICLSLSLLPPSPYFLSFLPCLPCGVVIWPLRGGESFACRFAPSSYDTRWHSMALITSTKPGSGDQIISLPGSISHILMCYTENRSHVIKMNQSASFAYHNMSQRNTQVRPC